MSRTEYAVRLLRIAEDDLTDIAAYIAIDRPAAAEALIAKVERRLSDLSRHPLMGRIPGEDELVQLGYRFLVVQNYLVFYTVERKTVLVHRIIHGARDYLKLL